MHTGRTAWESRQHARKHTICPSSWCPSPTAGAARRNPARPPQPSSANIGALALRAARRPDGWANRSTCSANLLLTLLLEHAKASQVNILQLQDMGIARVDAQLLSRLAFSTAPSLLKGLERRDTP